MTIGPGGIHAVDSLRGIYALVVDDESDPRTPLQTILRYCGAYVRRADSPVAALALMSQMLPDVLVVAVGDDAGLDLIRQVRTLKPETGGVMSVVGVGTRELEERVRALGVDGYLAKPFDPWELCRLVSSLTAT